MGSRKKNAAQFHHNIDRMVPLDESRCCERVGESYGESKRMRSSVADAKSAAFSSPCSTVTSSNASASAIAWSNQREDESSLDTAWTDDRHSSYLSCMEEMFVRNMYDREYCSVDICGEAAPSCEQDCVESKPANGSFKVMQDGGWEPLPCKRLHSWELPSPAIFSSPWVKHFKSKQPSDEEQVQEQIPKTTQQTPEKIVCRTSTAYEIDDYENVDDDDMFEVPDVVNSNGSSDASSINSKLCSSSIWIKRIERSTSSTSITGS